MVDRALTAFVRYSADRRWSRSDNPVVEAGAVARLASAQNQLLGVYLLFGAVLVGSAILLFLWMGNGW